MIGIVLPKSERAAGAPSADPLDATRAAAFARRAARSSRRSSCARSPRATWTPCSTATSRRRAARRGRGVVDAAAGDLNLGREVAAAVPRQRAAVGRVALEPHRDDRQRPARGGGVHVARRRGLLPAVRARRPDDRRRRHDRGGHLGSSRARPSRSSPSASRATRRGRRRRERGFGSRRSGCHRGWTEAPARSPDEKYGPRNRPNGRPQFPYPCLGLNAVPD